jgi:hypothetical protein
MNLVRYADRPDLRAPSGGALGRTFPEFMHHNAPGSRYVFPGGLAPLEVRGGLGRHVEPNVWMLHEV